MVAARPTAMDRRATATHTVAAARTPPAKARPTIAPTAQARHTMKAGARLTRTPMAVKHRANMGKARRIRMPTAVKLRVNTEKGRLTRTPMEARLQLNTGRARRIRTFMEGPLRGLMEQVHITRLHMARQPTLPPTIHLLPTMAIIRLPRSTTTDQHAPTATVGRLPQLSQPPLLRVRLLLQQMQTLPMLMPPRPTLTPTLRPRQPTLTTPVLPRVTQLQQPPIPWGSLLERFRPVALHPPSKARPTTCVAIPGSAPPTAQTAFTIA